MKELREFAHVSKHQPFDGEEISFRLKPMEQGAVWDYEASQNAQGNPTQDGIRIILSHIVGWKGESLGEFSRANAIKILRGSPNTNWRIWCGELAGVLYRRALLEGDAAKKS